MNDNQDHKYPIVDTGLGFSLYIDQMDSYGLLHGDSSYEVHEVATVKRLVKPGYRVFDIGANMGYFSIIFSKLVGSSGEVLAFEPDGETLELLGQNIQLNHADNVRVYPVALSDESSKAVLYRCPFNVAMHRLYPSVCCDDEGVAVNAIRGDALELAPPDFVKIDVEGFELPALRGLENTLRANNALVILSEFSPLAMLEAGYHPAEFIAFFKNLGYGLRLSSGCDWNLADWQVLETAVSVFAAENFARFHKAAAGSSKAALLDITLKYLAEIGYKREYFENVLLYGPEAKAD